MPVIGHGNMAAEIMTTQSGCHDNNDSMYVTDAAIQSISRSGSMRCIDPNDAYIQALPISTPYSDIICSQERGHSGQTVFLKLAVQRG